MAKQTRSKKAENVGKGKVTPVQVAFIVDRYLSDNNFTESRSTFRKEASSLISKTNVKEAPKSLMSLDSILDEYICLKEQKVLLEQEKLQVEQEKTRVEMLLQGMQCVMQSYNNSSRLISPPSKLKSMDLIPQFNPPSASPSGHPTNITPTMMQVPRLPNVAMESTNFSTPTTTKTTPASTSLPSQNKRKGGRVASDAPPATTKRQCRQSTRKTPSAAGNKTPVQASNTNRTPGLIQQKISSVQSTSQTNAAVSCLAGASTVRESSVAKTLFNQSSPPLQSSSPSPKTPPQDSVSQVDHSISPLENHSHINSTCNNSPLDRTPSNCAVISSSTKTVMVSPSKHLTCYSVERSHYFSSPAKQLKKPGTTRDHVKGRLDFGASDVPTTSDQTTTVDIPTSGSSDDDIFDMEMPNLDMFGPDFCLSEFLLDMDLDCQATNPTSDSGSPEGGFVNTEAHQSFSEFLSSATEILCEKDMNISDQDSVTSVKSMTTCVTITSPVKSRSSVKGQENCLTRN